MTVSGRERVSEGTLREMRRKPTRGRVSLDGYGYVFWIGVVVALVLVWANDSKNVISSETAQALFVTFITGLAALFTLPDVSAVLRYWFAWVSALAAEFWVVRTLSPLGSGYFHNKFVGYAGIMVALVVGGAIVTVRNRRVKKGQRGTKE